VTMGGRSVNNHFFRTYSVNDSGLGCLGILLLVALLLGSIGLGWIVNGFLIFFAFLLIAPIAAWAIFRWWLRKNLVEGQCPACDYEFTGFNNTECPCPNCGEGLKVEGGKFVKLLPPDTIEVDAIEVPVQQLED
jgi:Zn finger protein HypA/HybF involved in hydrogenase expression